MNFKLLAVASLLATTALSGISNASENEEKIIMRK
jgi:hypothetical protein